MSSRRIDTLVWSGLLILLILAPLPSASVSSLAQASLAFGLFTLLVIWCARSRSQDTLWPTMVTRRFRFLMLCWTSAMWFAFLQVLPFPPTLIADLSPSLSALYSWTLPTENDIGMWRPLSTTPAATVQIALLIGAYAAAFMLVAFLCRTRARILSLAMTIILVGVGEAIIGLGQLGGKLETPASGTFVNRNHFAALLIMALGLSLGMILARWHEDTGRATGTSDSGGRFDWWARVSPLFIISLMLLAAIFFSFSRTGSVAAFVMAVLFAIFGSLGSFRRFLAFLSVGVGSVALLLLTGAWRAFRIVAYRFESLQDSYRVAAWKGTYNLFESSPVVGIGLGSMVDNIARFLPGSIKEVFDHTHNEPLEILAEGGMIYAAVFAVGLLIYFVTVIPAWLKRKDPLARGLGWGCLVGTWAVFFFSLVEFPLRMPANALTLSMIFSLGWVVVQHRSQNHTSDHRVHASSRAPVRRRLMLLLAIAGMALSAMIMAGALLDRAGDTLLKQAEGTTGDKQQALLEKAANLYRIAQQIEPWQPGHSYRLGQVYERMASALSPVSEGSKSAWASATESYQKALRLHPANARVQASLAWTALHSGDLPQARRAAHAALRLAPGDPNVRFAVAKWCLIQWENLTVQEQESAVQLIRGGASDLPLEYVEALWRFVPDLKIIKSLLPDDLTVRRLLLGALTERQLFSDRWAEQEANPSLRILSPDRDVLVLSSGRLGARQQPPVEAVSRGRWTGMVEGWLSSGLTAMTRVELPPGEVVLFIPVRGEAAGGVWPILRMALGGHPLQLPILSENGWRTAYIHLYTKGGTFPLHTIVTNGAVIRENGQFVERRAKLGPVRILTPQGLHDAVAPVSKDSSFSKDHADRLTRTLE